MPDVIKQNRLKINQLQQQVASSYAAILALVNGELTELAPEQLYQVDTEDEWSLIENLAHIVEFMPYWASEISKLCAKPGTNFGRVMTDEDRLKAISEHGRDSLSLVRQSLPESYNRLQAVLAELTDADLNLTGVHSKFGEQNLEWFIAEFVTKHLQNHFNQLVATANAVKKSS